MEVYGAVCGSIELTAQLITFSVKCRDYAKVSQSLKQSLSTVENVSRNFRSVSIVVYQTLLEAKVNPNLDVHPDLKKSFEDANAALKTTSGLVKGWAKRFGMMSYWQDAEDSVQLAISQSQSPLALPKEAETDRVSVTVPPVSSTKPSSGDKRKWSVALNPYVKAKSMWHRCCFLAYGVKEVDKAVDRLLSERTHLGTLTATLPFQYSKRLKGAESVIIDAWKKAASTAGKSPTIIKRETHNYRKFLTSSYESGTWTVCGDGRPRQIFVERKYGQGTVDTDPNPRSNLDWICTMLGSIPHASIRDIGLLHCAGYAIPPDGCTKRDSNGIDALVFDPPKGSENIEPRTLRDLLNSRRKLPPSLTERIRISQTLVASVVALHSLGIVHRFLTPEGIVLFAENGEDSGSLGDLYLLGFGQSRPDKGGSGNYETENFRGRFYTHPDILTSPRDRKYTMIHDIYSLGICLLEIALWKPFFVPFRNTSRKFRDGKKGDFNPHTLVFDTSTDGPHWKLGDDDTLKARMKSSKNSIWSEENPPATYDIALERRDLLVEVAKKKLPRLVGQIFCDAVVACLEIDKLQLDNVVVTTECVRAAVEEKGRGEERAEDANADTPSVEVVPPVAEEKSFTQSGVEFRGARTPSPSSSSSALGVSHGSTYFTAIASTPGSACSSPGSSDSGRTSVTLCESKPPSTVSLSSAASKRTQSTTPTKAKVKPKFTPPSLVDEKQGTKAGEAGEDQDKDEILDAFLMRLLERKEISGSSAQTIVIARNILKKLERVNL